MSLLETYAGEGKDQIQDVKQPWLKIAQDVSPEMNKNKAEFMPELALGQFFCNVTKKIFGPKIQVIVLAMNKTYSYFEKQSFKGMSYEFKDDWRRDPKTGALFTQEGWKVVTCYNYLVIDAESRDDPKTTKMMLTLKNTDIPSAKDWNTRIKQLKLGTDPSAPDAPVWSGIWELEPVYREKDGKGYYALGNGKAANVRFVGFIEDDFVETTRAQHLAALQSQTKMISSAPSGESETEEY